MTLVNILITYRVKMNINKNVSVLTQGDAMPPKGNDLKLFLMNKVNVLMIK